LPGTDRESSRATAWPPKIDPAEAEAAKSAEAMLRSFILLCVWCGVLVGVGVTWSRVASDVCACLERVLLSPGPGPQPR
jgi:hypothetical protein